MAKDFALLNKCRLGHSLAHLMAHILRTHAA